MARIVESNWRHVIKVNFPMYFLDKQKENEIVIISS